MNLNNADIREYTKSIVAIIVVLGGGLILAFTTDGSREMIIGLMGVVLGYYFTDFVHSSKTTIINKPDEHNSDTQNINHKVD